MSIKNFKGDEYPADIETVIGDMQKYVKMVDEQLNAEAPHNIKEYILFDKGNKTDAKRFKDAFGFNRYHRKNKKMPEVGEPNEIKGLYVLAKVDAGKPVVINVGISQTILRRFYQHTCGKTHNQSTLGFYMALHKHNATNPEHLGRRDDFPYSDYLDGCLDDIRNLRFAIVPIDDNFELYMAEVYLACHYKAYWNTFETH